MRIIIATQIGRIEILERAIIDTLPEASSSPCRFSFVGTTVSPEACLGVPDSRLGNISSIEGPIPVPER
jgi:hypothetical protein